MGRAQNEPRRRWGLGWSLGRASQSGKHVHWELAWGGGRAESGAGRMGRALGSDGQSCGEAGMDHSRWAGLGPGLCV